MAGTTNILQAADEAVNGERNESYGHPFDDFTRAADIATVLIGTPLEPEDIGLILIAVKLAREVHRHKTDNLVDLAGYAQCLQRVHDRKAESRARVDAAFEAAVRAHDPVERQGCAEEPAAVVDRDGDTWLRQCNGLYAMNVDNGWLKSLRDIEQVFGPVSAAPRD